MIFNLFKGIEMKKWFIGISFLIFIITSGCTVVVSEHPSHYAVREVAYEGNRPVEVYYSGGFYYYLPSVYLEARYHHTRVNYYNSGSMRIATTGTRLIP